MEDPPVAMTDEATRRDEGLRIVPDDPSKPYDMKEIINLVVDSRDFMEVHEHYAPNIPGGFRSVWLAVLSASSRSSRWHWPVCWISMLR